MKKVRLSSTILVNKQDAYVYVMIFQILFYSYHFRMKLSNSDHCELTAGHWKKTNKTEDTSLSDWNV